MLSEEFFRFGINVAVWREEQENLFDFEYFKTHFGNPDWGYFAFASARAGIYESSTGNYRYNFFDPSLRE